MNDLINQDYLKKIIKSLIPEAEKELTGRTCSIDEFRKDYCANKSSEWVRTKIFDRYPETLLENGGFVLNSHSGHGRKTIIWLKPASEWLERHKFQIDWNEKL